MAERSYPFDAGSGAIVTEADWGRMASQWVDSGLIDNNATIVNNSSLIVTSGSPNQVSVSAGDYWIDGYCYVNDSAQVLTFTTNSNPTNGRMDRVVLRLDKADNSIRLAIKEGTPSGLPTPPPLIVDSNTTEVGIAQYQVTQLTSTAVSIVSERRPASRRIRFVTSTADIPWGGIAYRTIDNKFYMKNASGLVTELGGGVPFIDESSIPPAPADGTVVINTTRRRLEAYASSWPTGNSGWSYLSGMGVTKWKLGAGTVVSGSGVTVDSELTQTLKSTGLYRIHGTIWYSSNTAAATCTLSLQGPGTFSIRGLFRHHSGANTTMVQTVSDAFTSGCTIGSPSASTSYAATFDFSINASAIDIPIAIRTNAHSGSSTWQITNSSFLRIERL